MALSGRFAFGVTVFLLLGGEVFAAESDATQGRAIYVHYCVSCHGVDAEGNGPVAPVLKTPPTNLRLLSDLYGNPLQEDKVARAIDGRAEIAAHGPREMPVWGDRFSAANRGDELRVRETIRKLVAYLQSIQTGKRTASLQ